MFVGCSRPVTPIPRATVTIPPPTQPTGTPPAIDVSILAQNMDTPWAIDFAPDGRIFVTERPGRIRVIKSGVLLTEPWMTLDVAESGESGLLGLAIDPQFTRNAYIYVAYTYRTTTGSLENKLVRLREVNGRGTVDKILLDGVNGGGIHDGGRVKFGPDGKLYWTVGETGNSNPAQDLNSYNGKILRLNPDGTIPADNPFPGSFVYSYGHRNPQGLAWQPVTGRLYETEHGPSGLPGGRDEVNYIEAGKNYGWPVITADETRAGMVTPILQSELAETWAPGGATFVSQGPWAGSFLFVGLRGQSLYRVILEKDDPGKVLSFERLFVNEYGRLRDIVQGPDGAIYVSTSNLDGRGQLFAGDDKVLRITVK